MQNYRIKNFRSIIKAGFLIIILFGILQCSENATNSEGDNLVVTGTVNLENQTDHSGVDIHFYQPAIIDTVLTSINQDYPAIGVQVSQETEFDFINNAPAFSTVSNADGTWKIENLNFGKYNIVARHEDFGFQILHEVETTQNLKLTLKEPVRLRGFYLSDFTIPEESFVIIEEDVIINTSAKLNVGYGSVLLFKDNAKLEVKGKYEAFGNSSNYIFLLQEVSTQASSLKLDNVTDVTLSGLVIRHMGVGITIRNSQAIKVENCIFQDNLFALDIFNSNDIEIKDCILDSNEVAIAGNTSQCNISENIIINTKDYAYEAKNDQYSMLINNVFKNNNISLRMNMGFGFSASNLSIEKNDFINNFIHIQIGNTSHPRAVENNFLGSEDFAVIVSAGSETNFIYDFTKNYWQTFDSLAIANRIRDNNDDQLSGVIDFSDYAQNYISW